MEIDWRIISVAIMVIALGVALYAPLRHFYDKKKLKNKNFLSYLFIVIGFTVVVLLPLFLMNRTESYIRNNDRNQMIKNCRLAVDAGKNNLTNESCNYFMKVLDGTAYDDIFEDAANASYEENYGS